MWKKPMIQLSNGSEFEFVTASGALGYTGDGWWWEQPYRWAGLLDPTKFVNITKTLTFTERKGNLNMWHPWTCVRLLPDGSVVNAVAFTNPGIKWWIKHCYDKAVRDKRIIVSVYPESVPEAEHMGRMLNGLRAIEGIEFNWSCPNIEQDSNYNLFLRVVRALAASTDHPIILKLGFYNPYLQIIDDLKDVIEAFDLINTIYWKTIYPDKPSPLAKYNYFGSVSGRALRPFAIEALKNTKQQFPQVQVISGGAVDSLNEVIVRRDLKAEAVSFGSVFMTSPDKPNRIVREFNEVRGRYGF